MKDKLLKMETILSAIPVKFKVIYHNIVEEIKSSYAKLQDLGATNYDLGLYHIDNGNMHDAKLRFLLVTKLKPDHALAYYHLGRCYLFDANAEKASSAFKTALSLNSNLTQAKYRLDLLNRQALNSDMPIAIIQEDYNSLANKYENYIIEQKQYKAPELLEQAMSEIIKENHTILDLGCGTGLVGGYLAQSLKYKSLTGVDISENMLNLTKELNIDGAVVYNKTLRLDFKHLESLHDKFDIITACLSLGYLSNLAEILQAIDHLCAEKTWLGIVVLKSSTKDLEFNYEESAFAFSEELLKPIFKQFKWNILKAEEINIYAKNTPGLLFLLERG